jgi:aerobic carbon-monoxide dehydrogenase small subunit
MTGTVTLRLRLNGVAREAEVDPRLLLVEAVRDVFGLTGSHVGCLTGDCGACTMQVDGRIAKTCLLLAVQAEGADVVTIEGLARGGELHPIQRAFWEGYGFQCGYCLPGMLFSAEELLASNPRPSEAEIRDAIDGNLCRCTGYENIVNSVAAAAAGGTP